MRVEVNLDDRPSTHWRRVVVIGIRNSDVGLPKASRTVPMDIRQHDAGGFSVHEQERPATPPTLAQIALSQKWVWIRRIAKNFQDSYI